MTPRAVKFQGVGAERFSCGRGDALEVVDLQKDFLPGGALPVPGGEGIIAPLNGFLDTFSRLAGTDPFRDAYSGFDGSGGGMNEPAGALLTP